MHLGKKSDYCTNAICTWQEPVEPGQYGALGQRPVVYEHPLSERIRSFLRLEFLFRQAQHCLDGETPWDSRLFVITLIDILAVLARSDLKTELIKELERNATTLGRLSDKPGVDKQQLQNVLGQIDAARTTLHGSSGPLGNELRESEFLTAVRQRSSIPGGTCDFDVPAYHRWLHCHSERRKEDQARWFETLRCTRQSVELILKLLRNSATSTSETAPGGGFQRLLEPDVPYQLLRITLDASLPYFAEVSGGKHRFTLRFLAPSASGRPQQAATDVPFILTCCAL